MYTPSKVTVEVSSTGSNADGMIKVLELSPREDGCGAGSCDKGKNDGGGETHNERSYRDGVVKGVFVKKSCGK